MGAKRQLEYSVRASANLEAIKLYISADNPVAAIEVLENVLSSAEGLTNFPLLGHVGRRLGTRELILSKYPYTIFTACAGTTKPNKSAFP